MFEKMLAEEDAIDLKKEQHGVVRFLFLLETPIKCYSMMCEAYRDQVTSCRQVFYWHKQFREETVSSMAMKQSGRPVLISTGVTINTIKILIVDDSSLTQCEIAAHISIAKGTVQKILKNLLQMIRVCSC